MTTKHVFTTPYGGREIWRDGKPFAILAKPAGAPLDSTYYIHLSAFGRLSAAAPDLLEALERVAAWMDTLPLNYRASPAGRHEQDAVRAAIAKARGEVA